MLFQPTTREVREPSSIPLPVDEPSTIDSSQQPLPDAIAPLSPSPEDRGAAAEAKVSSATEQPSTAAESEPVAGPSGTSAPITAGEDYSVSLGMDISELPEGVDPSFLAALPEDMRQEVIDEQRRLQAIRQRAAQNTEAGITEVNPEFLAALPPNIQEEVLAQQRIEQVAFVFKFTTEWSVLQKVIFHY